MSRTSGFTLIEVLVATALLALTMGTFISGAARYADYARYIHDRTIAQWVARNQLVEYQIAEEWPDTGSDEGDVTMGDIDWQWVAEIEESQDPDVRRVDLRVFRIDPRSGEPQANSVTLLSGFVTQRIEPANAPPGGGNSGGSEDSDAAADEQSF